MKTAKIEVFKAGVYGNSESRIWSQEEVQGIVSNYDASYRNAPVILGHNDWDGKEKPAYGWATAFSINDANVLVAEIEYNDELGEMIKKKMYSRVSMELTKKIELYDRVGGKTGAYALAIAFLGSNQPAVSGLQPISFSVDDAQNGESFEFTQDELVQKTEEDNTGEHFDLENQEKDDTISQSESEIDLAKTQDKESFMTEQEIKDLQAKADKFDAVSADNADMQAKIDAQAEENDKFKAEIKQKSIVVFMAEHSKKIAPATAKKVQAFLQNNEDSVCEEFKNVISALPENAIFEKMNDEVNEDEHIDSDAKFSEQATKDLESLKQ